LKQKEIRMLNLPSLGAAVALVALSVFGATSAHAQSAMGSTSTDPAASDCLRITQGDTQISLIAITEEDELLNPGKM
jgi:hypothetical protein